MNLQLKDASKISIQQQLPDFSVTESSVASEEEEHIVYSSFKETPRSKTPFYIQTEKNNEENDMVQTHHVNRMFRIAANVALTSYLGLVTLVYALTPKEDLEWLPNNERAATTMGFMAAAISALTVILSFFFNYNETGKMSGIVYAGMAVMGMSMTTNALIAFGPTVVQFDHITQSRVFLVRWCEWIPCAGLLTFLTDAVDIPKSKSALREVILYSLSQSLSCVFAILFPFCPGIRSWSFAMTLSFILYFPIFPRLYRKYQIYCQTSNIDSLASSFIQKEQYHRHRFSFQLMLVCALLWTVLVVIYFANAYAHLQLPEDHFLRPRSLAIYCDVFFDVMAKAMYMRQIIYAHKAIFHAEGMTVRKLLELKRLMSALWISSSDIIVLSVQHEDKCLAILSPGFCKLVYGDSASEKLGGFWTKNGYPALVVEVQRSDLPDITVAKNHDQRSVLGNLQKAYLMDSPEFNFDSFREDNISEENRLDLSSLEAQTAYEVILQAWSGLNKESNSQSHQNTGCSKNIGFLMGEQLIAHKFSTHDNTTCFCEMKVLQHTSNGLIAVVRDISERIKRFKAEQKAQSESLKRQKESQSQTRFVRHEVKNGLLAGIELISNIRHALNDVSDETVELPNASLSAQLSEGIIATTGSLSDSSDRLCSTTDVHASTKFKQDIATSLRQSVPSVPPTTPLSTYPNKREHLCDARKRLGELDENLHEVLDTVLDEAMARDVISEVYKPRYEVINVMKVLKGDRPLQDRFTIQSKHTDFPLLSLDPQLLRYIHRNAVSNACKYGQPNGMVMTLISFDKETNMFELEVMNKPGEGHKKLQDLGPAVSDQVFFQGQMLHQDLEINSRFISSGDGAWIAQKCARSMGGTCAIRFEDDITVFSCKCPSQAVALEENIDHKSFAVPEGTVAIGVDDSKIQRKLISRIFDLLQVQESNKIIVGETPSGVLELEYRVLDILTTRPGANLLLLVDENLDYRGSHGEGVVVISGSRIVKDILTALPSEHEGRILALVRSANDATSDIAMYMTRAHGFFPKAPMNKARVQEIVAPLWTERFADCRRQAGERKTVLTVGASNESSVISGRKRLIQDVEDKSEKRLKIR